jgi:hypothetical protein
MMGLPEAKYQERFVVFASFGVSVTSLIVAGFTFQKIQNRSIKGFAILDIY